MIEGSNGAPKLLGSVVTFEPKDILKLKSPELPKCLHHILPLSDPCSCYCIAWARGSRTQPV